MILRENARLPKTRLLELGHTCATIMSRTEVGPKYAQDRLGHAAIISVTLNTYTHVLLPEAREEVTRKIEDALF